MQTTIDNKPIPEKLNKKLLTFICDKGQYSESDLKQFTANTGASVIIRGVALVENGKIIYFN